MENLYGQEIQTDTVNFYGRSGVKSTASLQVVGKVFELRERPESKYIRCRSIILS